MNSYHDRLAWLDAQLEAEAQVRKLEEGLRLEKDRQGPLLCSLGVGDEVGEQDKKLENFGCHSTKLGGRKWPWGKVPAFVTKSDWNSNRRNPWECRRARGGGHYGDRNG